ncbi:nucleotidyltransferase family protein [Desulfolithobacter sp.]
MKNVDEYKKILAAHRSELARKYHVSSLGLFGSRLRGEQREDSDLDVLVSFSTTPGLLQFSGLRDHLSDLLGVKVDLVMRDALKPGIRERILKEVELV